MRLLGAAKAAPHHRSYPPSQAHVSGSFLHHAGCSIMPQAFKDSFTATLCFPKLEVAAKQLGSIDGVLGGIPPKDRTKIKIAFDKSISRKK